MAKMGRPCTVCRHPEIDEINKQILTGETHTELGKRYDLARRAISRHAANHLPLDIVAVTSRPISVDSVMTEMNGLLSRANELELDAMDDEKPALQLRAIREQTRIIETMIKLAGILAQRATDMEANEARRSIADSVEWIALRTAIIAALHPYPEARQAVMVALGGQYAITSG